MIERMLKKLLSKYSAQQVLAFMLSLCHLDILVEKDYTNLANLIAIRKRLHSPLADCEDLDKSVSVLQSNTHVFIRLYRKLSIVMHIISVFKYSTLMAISENFLPVSLNCYLLGRFSLHEELIPYMPFFSLQLSFLQVLYRFFIFRKGTCCQLDVILFLLADEELLVEEMSRVEKLGQHLIGEVVYPNNVLQTVLFYTVRTGNLIEHKLRPNRSLMMRNTMLKRIKFLLWFSILVSFCVLFGVLPSVIKTAYLDAAYIKIYPGCCPLTEQLAKDGKLGRWSIRMDLCDTRRRSLLLDMLENAVSLNDNTWVLFTIVSVATLITIDLLEQWRGIDREVKLLLSLHKFNLFHKQNEMGCLNLCSTQLNERKRFRLKNLSWLNSGIPGSSGTKIPEDISDERMADLQALMEDFFECLARANKFVSALIRHATAYFILSNVIFLYFSLRIQHFWDLTLARSLIVNIYLTYLICIVLITRIQSATAKTYTPLCSLVAHDQSKKKADWAKVLLNYTCLKRNSHTLFDRVPFSMPYALNLMATSISFFIVAATLQAYKRMR